MTNTRLVGQHQPSQVLCTLEAGHQRHAAQGSVLFDLKKQFLEMRNTTQPQGPSSIIFDKKMAQRCGVWQIMRMTSLDQDQVSMKSNMFGFRGYSQMKFYKTYKTAKNGLVWFGLVRAHISC